LTNIYPKCRELFERGLVLKGFLPEAYNIILSTVKGGWSTFSNVYSTEKGMGMMSYFMAY